MDFEFGETPQAEAFFQRHDNFGEYFVRLIELCNKCFGEARDVKGFADKIYFRIGLTCRTEFLEVLFLAVNGHALGATRLLRGLYERAVTLAFLLKHPEKVQRFVEYASMIQHKLLQEARKLAPDAELNHWLTPGFFADAEKRYKQHKGEFTRPGNKKISPTWDIDFASQVRELGPPFSDYYLTAYLMPTLHVHATFTSIMPNPRPTWVQCDLTLRMAHALLLKVMELQNTHFHLAVDDDLNECGLKFRELWKLWEHST